MKKKPARVEETAAPYVGKLQAKTDRLQQAYTVILQRENDGFVAHCPEFDVASQGATAKEARANLAEAMELFMETASTAEIARRGKKLDLDAEELVLHAEISAASARDLGRLSTSLRHGCGAAEWGIRPSELADSQAELRRLRA